MPKVFKVALSSYGMSGRIFHAPFIEAHPHLELSVILERTQSASRNLYPNVTIVREFEAILADPDIDLVIVNTPNFLHYSMTKAALLAGKHVVVEKPFTPTVAEGEALIALARKQGLMLSVYHNRRLQAGFKTAQKLLAEKQLGALTHYELSIDRYRPQPGPKLWKEERYPGAGLLYDMGSHLLDEALVLFGFPQSLKADLRVERKGAQVCDYFHLYLEYPNHKAILKGSMLAREPAPAYVIHGQEGSYVKHHHDVQEQLLAAGVTPTTPDWAREGEEYWGILHNNHGRSAYPSISGSYQEYYDNIYRHLVSGEQLLVQPEQALAVIEMIGRAQSVA